MPFLLHSITLDWSIGLIPEFRFHLTNSPISRLDQTPKPPYFFLTKSRFSDLQKKGKIWSIWGGSNLNQAVSYGFHFQIFDFPLQKKRTTRIHRCKIRKSLENRSKIKIDQEFLEQQLEILKWKNPSFSKFHSRSKMK